jgi:hypothetical protein
VAPDYASVKYWLVYKMVAREAETPRKSDILSNLALHRIFSSKQWHLLARTSISDFTQQQTLWWVSKHMLCIPINSSFWRWKCRGAF